MHIDIRLEMKCSILICISRYLCICVDNIILFLETYNVFCTLGDIQDFGGLYFAALWDSIALMLFIRIVGLVEGLKAGLRSLLLNKLSFFSIFFPPDIKFLVCFIWRTFISFSYSWVQHEDLIALVGVLCLFLFSFLFILQNLQEQVDRVSVWDLSLWSLRKTSVASLRGLAIRTSCIHFGQTSNASFYVIFS